MLVSSSELRKDEYTPLKVTPETDVSKQAIRLDGMRFTGMEYRRIKVKHLLRATARGRCLFSFIELFIVRKYYKKKILLFD